MPGVEENIPSPLTGAARRFFDQLLDISLNDLQSETRCDICLETFGRPEDPESPTRLPCGHLLGKKCISTWLETTNSCPLCRRVLFAQEPPLPDPEPRRVDSFAETREFAEVFQPGTEADLTDDSMDTNGLTSEEAEAFMAELSAIRRQQTEHEAWFARFQAQDTWSEARRDAELRAYLIEVDQLDAQLVRLRVRQRELVGSRGVALAPRGNFL